jgi:mycofactocin system glycosyltransferase
MSGFAFSLTKDVYLEQNPRGYFLVSRSPIRTLRINQSLYSLLQKLDEYQSELSSQHLNQKESQLLHILFTLTYKGYYKLQRLADPKRFPSISVIVPTRTISQNLIECLESISRLDYPKEKLEILVVEDGASSESLDLSSFDVKRVKLEESRGPATARNTGAGKAGGEVLAFIDADCMADENWLKEIVPFFQIEEIGAVGGFVAGYYRKSCLDRYEAVSSSLNLGSRILFEGDTESNLYVPTCNILVRREVFSNSGGFKDGMHVGEDVDFCWRMRNKGYSLLYAPAGKVAHKHRNRLFQFLLRRGAYGTSEAILYRNHRDKRKKFLIPIWAGVSFLALIIAVLMLNPYPLISIPIFLGTDAYQKSKALKRVNILFSLKLIVFSTLRSHFSFYYFTSFHLIRYYLILLAASGFFYHPVWYFCAFAILLTSSVDYAVKKPKLLYPVFLFFYLLEHLSYQIGVLWGCLKIGYFGSYIPVFRLGPLS